MYTKSYEDNKTITIGEHEVPIPKMPPKTTMVNYGLKKEDQKYKRLPAYTDFSTFNLVKQKQVVKDLYHVFWEGRWHLINGEPMYVPGVAELFFSYWVAENGSIPDFRLEAVQFFLVLEWVEMDPNSLGLLVLKPRRIGDTEKALCWSLWRTIKWRNSRFAMQNKTGTDAAENFARLALANSKLPTFLKAITNGYDIPKKMLEFSFPGAKQTLKKIKNDDSFDRYQGIQALESMAYYGPSVENFLDGQRLDTVHGDEPGKWVEMNLKTWWNVTKRCLSLYNGLQITGKGILTTTVEAIESSDTLESITEFWHNSDPKIKNANNRTLTGLTRLFRDYTLNAQCDEFGFPKIEETIKGIEAEVEGLKLAGDLQGIVELRRKHPRNIDDALSVPAIDCVLLPHLLDNQQEWLKNGKYSDGRDVVKKEIRGHLVWKNGKGTRPEVKFIEDPHGYWYFTQQPIKQNAIFDYNGKWAPENRAHYSIGLDPIEFRTSSDQVRKIQKKKADNQEIGNASMSEAAITIYRLPNELVDCADNGIVFDQDGEITNPDMMQADQFVACWVHRPEDPHDVYEETLKACIYFGAQAFIESDKTYVLNLFHDNGYVNFLKYKSKSVKSNPLGKSRGQTNEAGAKATTHLIGLYVSWLQYWIKRRHRTLHLTPMIRDFRKFKITNRTERDLTVSAGFAGLGAMDTNTKNQIEAAAKKGWDKIAKYTANK